MLSRWRDPRSRFKLLYKVILHWGSAMIRGSLVQVPEMQAVFHQRVQVTLSVGAMCVDNPDFVCRLGSTDQAHLQLHPALLRLSPIISQYFTRGGLWLVCSR
jgi:hypothetical protein